MIQRIQTVYLALIILAAGLTFVFDFVLFQADGVAYPFNVMGLIIQVEGNPVNLIGIPFYLLFGLSMVLALATIFTYKKRDIQKKLGAANFILILLLTGALYYFALTIYKLIPVTNTEIVPTISWQIGLFMPIVMLVFCFLANRGIRKDDELVKSFDRLR